MEKQQQDEGGDFLSNHFLSFLNSHPLISVRGLETEIGMPKDTIRKAKESKGARRIPEKYFYQMGVILVNYGFNWPENIEE
ncbi:hypothetical protein [Runella limosa]|uniref:hypothetical protein n=1 Tax=Runella limosa TaxID=370978 RepID=UPI00040C498C|nr:hypothetical protein [Runella limosa]